jgi:hypothetical protein
MINVRDDAEIAYIALVSHCHSVPAHPSQLEMHSRALMAV